MLCQLQTKTSIFNLNLFFYVETMCFLSGRNRKWGHALAQLVEALRYRPEGRGLDSRWSHWNFSLT